MRAGKLFEGVHHVAGAADRGRRLRPVRALHHGGDGRREVEVARSRVEQQLLRRTPEGPPEQAGIEATAVHRLAGSVGCT